MYIVAANVVIRRNGCKWLAGETVPADALPADVVAEFVKSGHLVEAKTEKPAKGKK